MFHARFMRSEEDEDEDAIFFHGTQNEDKIKTFLNVPNVRPFSLFLVTSSEGMRKAWRYIVSMGIKWEDKSWWRSNKKHGKTKPVLRPVSWQQHFDVKLIVSFKLEEPTVSLSWERLKVRRAQTFCSNSLSYISILCEEETPPHDLQNL